jgi:hypothetical protein
MMTRLLGELRIYGARGEAYEVNDAAAVKNAKYISETKPTWSWSDKGPRD